MKRSEMIKEIAAILENITYDNIALKYAKKILDKIEDKGMYPPDTTIEDIECSMWNNE